MGTHRLGWYTRPAQLTFRSARLRCRALIILFVGGLLLTPMPTQFTTSAANVFAAPAFQAQWLRGEALAPNFWGPLPLAHDGQWEPYTEAPGGSRLVQYFDKGRMELTDGVVTNGLLATELISGRLQAGNNTFRQVAPAAIPVAGDPNNAGPTYAQIGASGLIAPAPSAIGHPTTRALSDTGASGTFAAGSSDAFATISTFDDKTQHNVSRAFADYRANAGLSTIGLAIAEPFWASRVLVEGAPRDVLVQAFERRVLTYTASNPDAFKVEMGNIGAHYFTWRADSAPPGPMTSTTGTIFLIMMENHGDDSILGSPDAPFINQLAAQNTVADRYFAIRHPSLPNYLALLGGHTYGIVNDCDNSTLKCVQDAPNLADALEAKGKTWKSYQEDLPQPCFLGDSAGGAGHYAIRHNPFAYFKSIRENPDRCERIVPLAQLDTDLKGGQAPDFAFITPNLTHDMHDSNVQVGDRFLQGFVPAILQSDAWKNGGALIVTWDEDEKGNESETCCKSVATGGRIPLLIVTPGGPKGGHITTPLDHYSLLRAIEDRWGLDPVGHSADADVPRFPDLVLGKAS